MSNFQNAPAIQNAPPLSLARVVLLERWPWRVLILGVSLASALFAACSPLAQKAFIDGILTGTSLSGETLQLEVRHLLEAFSFSLCAQVLLQLATGLATLEALKTQKRLAEYCYDRLLQGPGGLVGRRPGGEAVSLFAVDIPGATSILDQALLSLSSMLFPILLAPFLLLYYFAIPLYLSFSAIAVISIVNLVLAKKQSRFFIYFKQLAAERTGKVSEWIQNIRTIRILGWTRTFENGIFAVRKRETLNRKAMVTNGQIMNAFAGSVAFVLNILALTYLLQIQPQGKPPSAGELFSLLWFLGVYLSKPIRQFPWTVVIAMDAWSSIRRLERAVKIPLDIPKVESQPLSTPSDPEIALDIQNLNLTLNSQTILKNISFRVKKNELIAIVGEVGAGKSQLLGSLIGTNAATFGSYVLFGKPTTGPGSREVKQHFAYLSQEGFTMNASLRENVIFDYLSDPNHSIKKSNPDDETLLEVLREAEFDPAKETLSDGLDTEIGERGVNLSGGQKQRINLARAAYSRRPILLMDDSLSAVDVATEKALIYRLIHGPWKHSTRILATQRMAILPQVDRIFYIKNQELYLQGTYSELMSSSSEFRHFVSREHQAQANQAYEGVLT